MLRAVTTTLLALPVAGCVTARNYANPRERITPGTAHTLAPGDTEIGTAILGLGVTDVGASLGVRHGFGRHFQVGANLAHAMLGIATVTGKANVVDFRHFGFGVDAGLLYARPKLVWALPDHIRDPIDRLTLVTVPLTARFSFPVNRWFSAHAGLGYTHAAVFGPIEADGTFIEAGLGVRRLRFTPLLHFFAGRRVAFIVGADLPLYAVAREDVTARTELQPGAVLTVVSSEWVRLPFEATTRYHAGLEVRFGQLRHTYVRVLVVRGMVSQAGLAPPVAPALRTYWRF